MTHYDNLKVPWDAPPEVIDRAYKALMKKYHPDRNANREASVRMTQIINASYDLLRDPVKRHAHDEWIKSELAESQQSRGENPKNKRTLVLRCLVCLGIAGGLLLLWIVFQVPYTFNRASDDDIERAIMEGVTVDAIPLDSSLQRFRTRQAIHPHREPSYSPNPSPFNSHTSPLFTEPEQPVPQNWETIAKANRELIALFNIESSQGTNLLRLTEFMKTVMNELLSQRNDSLREIDAIGWPKILDPERLGRDKNLIEGKMMIQKAKEIVAKYRIKTYALLDDAQKDIGHLRLGEDTMGPMAQGFDAGIATLRRQIDASCDLELKIIAEVENIFALLSGKNSMGGIHDGKIAFKSKSDFDAFNSHVSAIHDLVQQGAGISRRKPLKQ
jgi:curved DNA-binding protein CbpA